MKIAVVGSRFFGAAAFEALRTEKGVAPIGLELLPKVVRHAQEHGHVPAKERNPRSATKASLIPKPSS
jgi:hypothetical protein